MSDTTKRQIASLLSQAQSHIARGDLAAAAAACEKATTLDPTEGGAFAMLALVRMERGELDAAGQAAGQALRLMPNEPALLSLAAAVSLRQGKLEEALALTEANLAVAKYSQRAIADQAWLLTELGRDEEAHRLLDFKRLVKLAQAPVPAGFESVAALNAALVTAIVGHPDLEKVSAGRTLVDGFRLHNALALEPLLTKALKTMFLHAGETWAVSLDVDLGHPVAIRPNNVNLVAWANVMPAGGYERPHIHEEAWISGVYYVEMPPLEASEDELPGGALLFGGHDADPELPFEDFSATILPEPGQLILFPSYLYHRTLPFEGPGRRITIAFDILPR